MAEHEKRRDHREEPAVKPAPDLPALEGPDEDQADFPAAMSQSIVLQGPLVVVQLSTDTAIQMQPQSQRWRWPR